jgi:bacillithiol biosynthesis cysteine-adding enzyme BshC
MRGAPSTARFLSPGFAEENARVRATSRAGAPPPDLLEALEEGVQGRPAAEGALARLARGAAAVVTGQQAGLLLGPLYTFHKALGALAAAARLEEETSTPCVAVFWVQDEDHDFAEAAAARWLGADGALEEIRLPDDAPRVAIGDRPRPSGLAAALEPLLSALRGAPFEAEAAWLIEPWRSEATWSGAFVASLTRAFSDDPLLVLRGRHAAVARAASPLQRRALEEVEAAFEAVDGDSRALAEAGFRVQVEPRPGCALGFFHPEGVGGPRHRPRLAGDRFALPGASFSRAALLERLEAEPLAFSTSALLRVLVQDTLLPVAVHMVGPAEASYLGQLGRLRARWSVPAPLPAPRASARWLEPVTRRRLRDLGVSAEAALGDPEALLAERAPGGVSPSALRARLLEPAQRALEGLGALEPPLDKARAQTLASFERQVARFVGKLARAEAERDAVAARRLAEARARLLPGGAPQERVLGLVGLVARHGLARLKDCFRAGYTPFSASTVELEP